MKKSIEIVLVSLNGISNAGGAERMTFYLFHYFISRGYKVSVLDEEKLKNSLVGKLFWKIFKWNHFEKRRLKYIARFSTGYLWLTSCKKIVISNGEPTAYYPTDIVISHGCNHKMELDYGKENNDFTRVSKLQKKACENAQQIIVVAPPVKDDLVNIYKIDPEKISIIHNCIDTDFFYPIPKEETLSKTIVYVGRLEKGKGLHELITLSRKIESSEEFKLIIVSNNNANVECFENLKNTEVMIGLGVDNINKQAYSRADVVYYPSHSESFGLVIIEALVCGRPIAGNAVGILPSLVGKKYPGAYLLPQNQTEDVLEFLTKCIIDSKKFTPNEISNKVTDAFNIESYYKHLDRFFSKKMSGNFPDIN